MAVQLYRDTENATLYKDHKFTGTDEEYLQALAKSTTLYVGNLSFYTTEEQIYELFSQCGEIKRIIMGLDRLSKTPCGFCFVEYYTRKDAEDCVKFLSGSKLDDRIIRVDYDWGFKEDRQYGRGKSGGQVRDEYRQDYDPGRGGYGKLIQRRLEERSALYAGGIEVPTGSAPTATSPPMGRLHYSGPPRRDYHESRKRPREHYEGDNGYRERDHKRRRRDDQSFDAGGDSGSLSSSPPLTHSSGSISGMQEETRSAAQVGDPTRPPTNNESSAEIPVSAPPALSERNPRFREDRERNEEEEEEEQDK